MYRERTFSGKRFCTLSLMAITGSAPHNLRMARKAYRPTFVRQWRQYRGLTLEQLAEKIGTTHATLSRVERGKLPYNQELLEHLAEALATDVASLISRDPSQKDAIWALWDRAEPGERRQIEALAETILSLGRK